jgi:hypothetical protein
VYKKIGKDDVSRLSAFIEEIDTKQLTDGWSSKLT